MDIQIIGRKPHAPAGLDGWIGFKNNTIREYSDLPRHSSLPSIQAVVGEAHNRLQPMRRQINRGPYQSGCTCLSGNGRIGDERMIARNSNKMSERSSRLDIASNRISRAASDVGALAP